MKRRSVLKTMAIGASFLNQSLFAQDSSATVSSDQPLSFQVTPNNDGLISYTNDLGQKIDLLCYSRIQNKNEFFDYNENTLIHFVTPDTGGTPIGILSSLRNEEASQKPSFFGSSNPFQFLKFGFLRWNAEKQKLELAGVLQDETEFLDPYGVPVPTDLGNQRCIGLLPPRSQNEDFILILSSLQDSKITFVSHESQTNTWRILYGNNPLSPAVGSSLTTSYAIFPGNFFSIEEPVLQITKPLHGMTFLAIKLDSRNHVSLYKMTDIPDGQILGDNWEFDTAVSSENKDTFIGIYHDDKGRHLHLYVTAKGILRSIHWKKTKNKTLQPQVIHSHSFKIGNNFKLLRLDSPDTKEQILVGFDTDFGFYIIETQTTPNTQSSEFIRIPLSVLNSHPDIQSILSGENKTETIPRDFLLKIEKIADHEKSDGVPSKSNPAKYRLYFFDPHATDKVGNPNLVLKFQISKLGFESFESHMVYESQWIAPHSYDNISANFEQFDQKITDKIPELRLHAMSGLLYFFPEDMCSANQNLAYQCEKKEKPSTALLMGTNKPEESSDYPFVQGYPAQPLNNIRTFSPPTYFEISERTPFFLMNFYIFLNSVAEICYASEFATSQYLQNWVTKLMTENRCPYRDNYTQKTLVDFFREEIQTKFLQDLNRKFLVTKALLVMQMADAILMPPDALNIASGFFLPQNPMQRIVEISLYSFQVRRCALINRTSGIFAHQFQTYYLANMIVSPHISFEDKIRSLKECMRISGLHGGLSVAFSSIITYLTDTLDLPIPKEEQHLLKHSPLITFRKQISDWRFATLATDPLGPEDMKVRALDFRNSDIPSSIRSLQYLLWWNFFTGHTPERFQLSPENILNFYGTTSLKNPADAILFLPSGCLKGELVSYLGITLTSEIVMTPDRNPLIIKPDGLDLVFCERAHLYLDEMFGI